jgi:uncharacterized protein YndB with AHSA1/START domain
MKTKTQSVPSISDSAVQAKTGKVWKEWFSILDAAGAREMSHKEIVALLTQKHRVGPWWQQMVTVTYEQVHGLRRKHEKPGGFEISASKTIAVPVSVLYRAWRDRRMRGRWFAGEGFSIRKATANRSLRITWSDGNTGVVVNFYPKDHNKCQVTVQHGRLPNARGAARMKAYWSQALDLLKSTLES